jgi:hypothetical protein
MWLDYDDKYTVSEEGLVMHKRTGRITRGNIDPGGYMKHMRVDNRHHTMRYVHRMIAERFLPKIEQSDIEVDHINQDKTDNRASNLRWVSRSVNDRNRTVKLPICGHRYIRQKPSGNWAVEIDFQEVCYRKTFATLEEAITARDEQLKLLCP